MKRGNSMPKVLVRPHESGSESGSERVAPPGNGVPEDGTTSWPAHWRLESPEGLKRVGTCEGSPQASVRGTAIQQRISAYMAATDTTQVSITPCNTLTAPSRHTPDSSEFSSSLVSPHLSSNLGGRAADTFSPTPAKAPLHLKRWSSGLAGFEQAEQNELEDLRLQHAIILAQLQRKDDELQRKQDEIALLAHLANTNCRVPITEELAARLATALTHITNAQGQAFHRWLEDMTRERQQRDDELDSLSEKAGLLDEARMSLAQLVVIKAEEASESERKRSSDKARLNTELEARIEPY